MNNIEKKKNNKEYEDLKAAGIQNIIIGTSAITFLAPIYISNIDKESIPSIALTLIGVGIVYLPINGIKQIMKASAKMQLTKNNNTNINIDKTLHTNSDKKKIKTK